MTYKEIRKNKEVLAYLKKGNDNLGVLGFTDHSEVHCTVVAERAGMILKKLGYSDQDVEVAKIAGFMHDIGNAVNRKNHGEYGALLADRILEKTDLPLEDRVTIVSAIGTHDESTGGAKDAISAALILADKTDVRRNRVRPKEMSNYDIHDRVNYSVRQAELAIDREEAQILLSLTVDTEYGSVMDYFEIFMGRMLLCRKAAEKLGLQFKLKINGQSLI